MNDPNPDSPSDTDDTTPSILDTVGPLWTAARTARALDMSEAVMAKRRTAGTLLGLRSTEGDLFYPVAQFEQTEGGRIQVKTGLENFLVSLRSHDPWTIAIILHTPAVELDDLTPLEWHRGGGDSEALVDYAQMLNAEWSR